MIGNLRNKLLMIALVFSLFFIAGNVNALESNQIELDFAQIDNPWGFTEKRIITLPDEVLNHNYYHIQISNKKELNFWYYDKPMKYNVSDNKLEFESQQVNLQAYLYDDSSDSFYKNGQWSWNWSSITNGSDGNLNIIFAPYDMGIPQYTKFPNWTYQYKTVKEFYDNNSLAKKNMSYLIKKLNFEDYKYIITSNVNGRFYILISKDNKEFNLDYKEIRYSSSVYLLNNASSAIGEDLYNIEDLTEEKIDDWLSRFENNKEDLGSQTLGTPFWGYPNLSYDTNIILYSSFNNDNFIFKNYLEPIFINDIPFVGQFPTFNNYYKNYFDVSSISIDETFEQTILMHDIVKSAKVYFNVPLNYDMFFEYKIHSKEGNDFYQPILQFYDSATGKWEYSSNNGELSYGSYFHDKIFDGVAVKPTINQGYLYIDVSSSTSDLILQTKSDFITKIELEYYNKDSEFVKESDLDGYHCYDINHKKLDEFNLNFRVPKNSSEDFLDYRLFAINQTDKVHKPYIAIFNALYQSYEKYSKFDNDYDKLYTEILPGAYEFQHYNNLGYINVLTEGAKSDIRLCVDSEYIIDYTVKLHEVTDAEKDFGDWLDDVSKFLNSIKEYIIQFFGLVSYLFNSLPEMIRVSIVSIFIVFIAVCIVIIARK